MKAIGTANTWFSFNGIRNDELGVYMLSMPTRPHPARKGKVVDIPGGNDLWMDEGGYKRIIIPIRLITTDNTNIDDINAWLSGDGDLIFGDEPERLYHARITKEFSRSNRSQRLRGQEFTVSFDCEPYRYRANPQGDNYNSEESDILLPITITFSNPGTAISRPIFKVTGEGTVNLDIYVGGLMRQRLSLEDMDPLEPVFIDCEAKIAYKGMEDYPSKAYTSKTSGDWLYFPMGEFELWWYDNVSAIEIKPRWRWL